MKVAFLMRPDALSKPGGDTVQIKRYIAEASAAGLFEGHLIVDSQADLSSYDVVNLTNIDRPIETYAAWRSARKYGKPTYVHTIHHAYDEIRRYERSGRGGLTGIVSGSLNFQCLEAVRTVIRARSQPGLIRDLIVAVKSGIRECQRKILLGCDGVFVLSNKESQDIQRDFDVSSDRHVVCRNGFDGGRPITSHFEGRAIDVLVVGRIEARKNQLRILRVAESMGVSVVFLGLMNKFHRNYCQKFSVEVATSRSRYVGAVPPSEVSSWMRQAKVHVSASWFEVASLVDIEAYSNGCAVVSSVCGSTDELLGDSALYVDPSSDQSIAAALSEALRRSDGPFPEEQSTFPSWRDAVDIMFSRYSEGLMCLSSAPDRG